MLGTALVLLLAGPGTIGGCGVENTHGGVGGFGGMGGGGAGGTLLDFSTPGGVQDMTMTTVPPDMTMTTVPPDMTVTWTVGNDGDNQMRDLVGVWGSSGTDIYVVGIQSAAYHSSNHGASWQAVSGLPSDQYSSIWGTAADNIYVSAGAGRGGSVGNIYRFHGGSWTAVSTGTQPLAYVWGTSASDIYAVGANGTILHATDGVTFTAQTSNTTVQLAAVGGSAGDVYVVGGDGGGSSTNTILHSTNAGGTWTAQMPVAATSVSAGVWGSAAMTAFVTSYANAGLALTTNGGGTWSAGPANPTNSAGFYGIWGTSATDVYLGGRDDDGRARGALRRHVVEAGGDHVERRRRLSGRLGSERHRDLRGRHHRPHRAHAIAPRRRRDRRSTAAGTPPSTRTAGRTRRRTARCTPRCRHSSPACRQTLARARRGFDVVQPRPLARQRVAACESSTRTKPTAPANATPSSCSRHSTRRRRSAPPPSSRTTA